MMKTSAKHKRELAALKELIRKHGYMILPKPKSNVVFNLKAREAVEHYEYKLVVPLSTALATAFPKAPRKRAAKPAKAI